MTERIPADVFSPGDFIKEEIEVRGWTQRDLAAILGRPVQMVNELLSGRKAVTPETACGLAEAFGTSAELWLNLESSYRLFRYRQKDEGRTGEVSLRGRLYELAPIKDMMARQWIPESTNVDDLEASLDRFFRCKVKEGNLSFPLSAKKSTTYGIYSPIQTAWAWRARQLAETMSVAKFNKDTFEKGLSEIHKLIAHEANVRHLPRALADLGVRFVVVERLPSSHLDGAAFWLEKETQPVVAVSMRFDRIDNFWFALAHECAHILHGDEGSIDENLVGEDAVSTDDKPEHEKRADLWAENYLLTTREIEKFILRVRPLYSKSKINQFADRVQVHPGIIVGQLQRRKEIPYSHNREMLVKVKTALAETAMTDGWGITPGINS